jgi:aspartyl-tRNA(Asn)/glutamyl-tRNA(Gln) amidotransferase subunit A
MQVVVPPYLTIAEAAELIRTRQLSPLELTEALLARIEALDPMLHAFITVTAEHALAQARAATDEIARGHHRGPLHGIPVALKDLYATNGIRTTCHSRVLADWIPEEDCEPVRRLYAAGAVLLGKLATMEFATGSVTEGPWPAARNPWNPDHIPGGSSSGSGTAVAAGLCLGSLGTDTGGSIRGPAALCGITGLRPTYGRVSRRGVVALAWSLDTAGPMTRTVTDCALMLGAVAGFDPGDPGSADVPVPDYRAALGPDLTGLTVAVDRRHFFFDGIDAEVLAAVETAIGVLRDLGAAVREIDLPLLDYAAAAQNTIHMSESHAYHEQRIKQTPELYGPTLRAYFRLGATIRSTDYLQAQRVRERIRAEMLATLRDGVDLIVAPTQAAPAEPFARYTTRNRFGRMGLTAQFSLAGVPAISVPCGFSAGGLPIGLQIAGRPFEEATVFRAAHAYEQATPWHTMRPVLESRVQSPKSV